MRVAWRAVLRQQISTALYLHETRPLCRHRAQRTNPHAYAAHRVSSAWPTPRRGHALPTHHTLKPSERRHCLCASMLAAHSSSPFMTMHSSRTLRVSGQAQQILHVGFFSASGAAADVDDDAAGGDVDDDAAPMAGRASSGSTDSDACLRQGLFPPT